MDPFSQGFLGAAAAQSIAPAEKQRKVLLLGFLAGGAADLDIFIRFPADPIGSMMMHRHFTHALAFIPLGALFCGLAYWLILQRFYKPDKRFPFKEVLLFTGVAYGTHALLDACTSYGTRLFWPLSDARTSWDFISIIDPFFTIPLAIGCIAAAKKGHAKAARIGLGVALCYMTFCAVQSFRAAATQEDLAQQRGHTIEHGRVMPMLGHNVTWRSVYKAADGNLYADKITLLGGRPAKVEEGASVPAQNAAELLARVPENSALAEDITQYAHFSDGLLYWHPTLENVLVDGRYSRKARAFEPLWGITIDINNPQKHVERARFSRWKKVE